MAEIDDFLKEKKTELDDYETFLKKSMSKADEKKQALFSLLGSGEFSISNPYIQRTIQMFMPLLQDDSNSNALLNQFMQAKRSERALQAADDRAQKKEDAKTLQDEAKAKNERYKTERKLLFENKDRIIPLPGKSKSETLHIIEKNLESMDEPSFLEAIYMSGNVIEETEDKTKPIFADLSREEIYAGGMQAARPQGYEKIKTEKHIDLLGEDKSIQSRYKENIDYNGKSIASVVITYKNGDMERRYFKPDGSTTSDPREAVEAYYQPRKWESKTSSNKSSTSSGSIMNKITK